ncbi:MAG: hypothetical protein ABIR91_05795 [Candidatus Saccharimonadales bacterium]
MAKQKKKRNKVYRGSGAAMTRPTITKVSAVNRNKLQQWWFDNKRVLKPIIITALVIIAIIWLVVELVRAVSGG